MTHNSFITNKEEGRGMKKSLAFVSLIAVLVFAFAGSAFASGGYDYKAWNAASQNGALATPHKDYKLNSSKCAVCHSVHNAAVTGTKYGFGSTVEVYNDGETQMLLRSSVADACTYCHITTNIGVTQVYQGVAANYTTDSTYNHSSGHAACSGCHAVHGANTMNGAITAKNLRGDKGFQTEAAAMYSPVTGTFAEQETVFCTQCHKYYSGASETTMTYTAWNGDNYTESAQSRKHHPLTAATADFTANGSTIGAGKTVAFAGSQYCISCHDAGVGAGFPHNSPVNARFMKSFSSIDATESGNMAVSSEDGACLKCHVGTGAASGVGVDF